MIWKLMQVDFKVIIARLAQNVSLDRKTLQSKAFS